MTTLATFGPVCWFFAFCQSVQPWNSTRSTNVLHTKVGGDGNGDVVVNQELESVALPES
jgi:hypothetical protein